MTNLKPLSKSEFVRGLDCERRVWLDRFRPDLKPTLSLASRERMETGRLLGKLAHKRYAEGIFVPNPGEGYDAAAESTMALMDSGSDCLFEATFISGGRLARLDVLSRGKERGWVVDEVKSSSVKEPAKLDGDKVRDLAFQVLTATRAGLEVESARLVLVDTSYVWPGGDYDASAMLGTVELTKECSELEGEVESLSSKLIEVLESQEQPSVETNTHCKTCDYFEHCHESRPKNDVIFLPRITPSVVRSLREKGYDSIEQIPEEEKLTDARRRMRDVIVSGKPHIGEGLAGALDSIPFPAAFIDYESSNPAFPMYQGTRPYQQVCFQWSAHVLDSPTGTPVHREFLPVDRRDPREDFCRTLWEVVSPCASIVHYTGFEITQLRSMAKDEIPLASELLEAIETRTVDLQRIVAEHVYLEEFRGRTSIKVVLPALVPGMSYKDLMIADGTAAAFGFRKMLSEDTPADEASELRVALLEYCCQDTLAMVEIYRVLRLLAAK